MTFDHLHLLWVGILTDYFVPGVGNLTFFYGKCQNPHPLPDPPPLGLNIDRCIMLPPRRSQVIRSYRVFNDLVRKRDAIMSRLTDSFRKPNH